MKSAKEIKMTNIPLEEIVRKQESVMKAHIGAQTANKGPRLQPVPKFKK